MMTVASGLFWLFYFFKGFALSICQANTVLLIVWQQISCLMSLLTFQTSNFQVLLQHLAAGHRPTSRIKPICRPRVLEFAHLFSCDVNVHDSMIPSSWHFAQINCKRTVIFVVGLPLSKHENTFCDGIDNTVIAKRLLRQHLIKRVPHTEIFASSQTDWRIVKDCPLKRFWATINSPRALTPNLEVEKKFGTCSQNPCIGTHCRWPCSALPDTAVGHELAAGAKGCWGHSPDVGLLSDFGQPSRSWYVLRRQTCSFSLFFRLSSDFCQIMIQWYNLSATCRRIPSSVECSPAQKLHSPAAFQPYRASMIIMALIVGGVSVWNVLAGICSPTMTERTSASCVRKLASCSG